MPKKPRVTAKKVKVQLHKLYLLRYAPKVRDMTSLAKLCGVARQSIYRYLDDHIFKAELEKVLGARVGEVSPIPFDKFCERAMEKGEVQIDAKAINNLKKKAFRTVPTEVKTLRIKVMKEKPKGGGGKIKRENALVIATGICGLVAKGVTVMDACEAHQLNPDKFYDWMSTGRAIYSQAIRTMYDEAKLKWRTKHNDDLVTVARKSLSRLVADVEYTDTIKIGRIERDPVSGASITIPTMVKQTTKKREAKLEAIKMVMGILDEDFSPKQAEKSDKQKESIKFVSDEELDQLIEEAKKTAGL